MTVDVLSSIKGAKPSEAVNSLFNSIKNAHSTSIELNNKASVNSISIDELREDIVVKSTDVERTIIQDNFPNKKNGYLVVAKVIEN